MIGRRLLDAAAILKASRNVLSKYFDLQEHRFNTYNKTSSLAKAIKSQADRVTLTLRAVSALNQRLKDPVARNSSPGQNAQDESGKNQVSKEHNVRNLEFKKETKDDVVSGHNYEGAQKQTRIQTALSSDRKAERLDAVVRLSSEESTPEPTHNGIKPSESQNKVLKVQPSGSTQAQSAVPQSSSEPDTQAQEFAIIGESRPRPNKQHEALEDVYSEIFHSPKVAKLLSRKGSPDKYGLSNDLQQASIPPSKPSTANAQNANLDQGTRPRNTLIHPSEQDSSSLLASKDRPENDIDELVTGVSEDTQRVPEKSEACFEKRLLEFLVSIS